MKSLKFFMLLLLLNNLLALATYAKPNKNLIISDPQAKAILDKVSQRFKALESVQIDFALNIVNKDATINEKQVGKIYIHKDMYKIESSDFDRICNGKSLWTFFKEQNEVQVTDYEPSNNEISPSQLFTLYEKNYDYSINKEAKPSTKYAYIDLVPKNKNINFFKVKLTIDKASNTITKAIIFERNGTQFTYELKNYNSTVKLPDSTFVFNPSAYPNVEVIDLR